MRQESFQALLQLTLKLNTENSFRSYIECVCVYFFALIANDIIFRKFIHIETVSGAENLFHAAHLYIFNSGWIFSIQQTTITEFWSQFHFDFLERTVFPIPIGREFILRPPQILQSEWFNHLILFVCVYLYLTLNTTYWIHYSIASTDWFYVFFVHINARTQWNIAKSNFRFDQHQTITTTMENQQNIRQIDKWRYQTHFIGW